MRALGAKIVRRARVLLPLLIHRPQEFCDQMLGITEFHLGSQFDQHMEYETLYFRDMIRCLETRYSLVPEFLREPELGDIEDYTRQRLEDIDRNYPLPADMLFNADVFLARLCYALCRELKPNLIVETGVAYGVTSSFMLKALAKNGNGVLHSVDLPPPVLGADRFVGITVSQALKTRWELHLGASRRVLPKLLKEIGGIDVFVHDSLHTYRNMRREFEVAWSHLRDGGILIADDVGGNSAFGELKRWEPAFWGVVQDKNNSAIYGDPKYSQFDVLPEN